MWNIDQHNGLWYVYVCARGGYLRRDGTVWMTTGGTEAPMKDWPGYFVTKGDAQHALNRYIGTLEKR